MVTETHEPLTRRRFDVDDYHRMVTAGILEEGDRVELLDGEVVEMSPIGPPHGAVVDRLNHWLTPRVEGRCIVRVQGAVRLGRYSEPQPDLALLRARADYYASRQPLPADVLLLIEVADSTLAKDRGFKAKLYAQAGIASYWVIDVEARSVWVHENPTPKGYDTVRNLGADEELPVPEVCAGTLTVREVVG